MSIESLFRRIADEHDCTVEATVLNDRYAKLLVVDHLGQQAVEAEIFPYEATDLAGARVPLVRVQVEDLPPVLVSPIPSAILAVILR